MKEKNTDLIALFSAAVVALVVGSVFYRFIENWTWIDSIYFSVITLTTVGYGDLAPTTPISKIFTMVYVFVGIGIIFLSIRSIAKRGLDGAVNRKMIFKNNKKVVKSK